MCVLFQKTRIMNNDLTSFLLVEDEEDEEVSKS